MDIVLLLFTTLLVSALLYTHFSSSKSRARHNPPLPPGPKGWPIIGNLPQLGPKPHQTLAALSRTYGPLFHLRLGSVHVVVAASSSVASLFLKAHDANFFNRPPNSGAEHMAYNYQDLVFAPYGPRWRMLRKLCAVHLFSAKALDEYRHVRENEVALLARNLARAEGRVVKLGEELNVCVTDALARAMVGRRVFGAAGKEAEEFRAMVGEVMKLAGVFNVGDFVPGLGWLDVQGVVGKMKALHRRFDEFFDKLIAKHHVEGGERDLLSVLVGLRGQDVDGEGGKLTDTEIKGLLLNLFTAGTDTSSSTVEWALAELISHPDILVKAQQELDFVVGRDRLVSEPDLANLPILQAIVKETFRLHPSTPLSLPRVASENCEINGYHIPKNATLLVNVWAIGRDPEVWPSPLEFRPARFLPGGAHADIDLKGTDFWLIPFGAGRRICAGMSLGLRTVQLLTATLVHAFDWALSEDLSPAELSMEEVYGLTLQRADPLIVHPRPRLHSDAYMP